MMRLLRSWRDSLLLLAPQNFKLFALVTLKSTFETYKVLARVWYLWLFSLISSLWAFARLTIHSPETDLGIMLTQPLDAFNYAMSSAVFLGFSVWLTVIYCLATRPSIGQKTANYFYEHKRFIFKLIAAVIFCWLLNFGWLWLRSNGFLGDSFPRPYDNQFTTWMASVQAFAFFILTDFTPSWIFGILFFLDSDGSVMQFFYASIRAIKMAIYNAPLLIILVTLMTMPSAIVMQAMISYGWLNYMAPLIYILLLKPLIINIWTNIYIKKFHEMPDLYFKQPK